MRALVHDPMNTVSTAMSCIGVPASRPMYVEGAGRGVALDRVGEVVGDRDGAVDRRPPGPGWCPR